MARCFGQLEQLIFQFFEPAARGLHEKEQKIVLFCIQSLLRSESTLMNFLKIRKQYKRKQEEKEIRR